MEDERVEKIIEQNNKLIHENNELLKKIYRYIKWKRIFATFYWILIIGTIFGLFFFLEPYIDQALKTYESAVNVIRNVGQQ